MMQVTSKVYQSSFGQLCLLIEDGEQVKFIPIERGGQFQVHETSRASFDHRYAPMPEYPVVRVAQLCWEYANALGASDEVWSYLNDHVTTEFKNRRSVCQKQEK